MAPSNSDFIKKTLSKRGWRDKVTWLITIPRIIGLQSCTGLPCGCGTSPNNYFLAFLSSSLSCRLLQAGLAHWSCSRTEGQCCAAATWRAKHHHQDLAKPCHARNLFDERTSSFFCTTTPLFFHHGLMPFVLQHDQLCFLSCPLRLYVQKVFCCARFVDVCFGLNHNWHVRSCSYH